MECPEFIKCEPEWYPSTEESSESVPSFEIPCGNLVEVKIESGVSSNEQLEDEGCSEEATKEEYEEGVPNEEHGIIESTSNEGGCVNFYVKL
ncbi:uncharacterized protein [Anabrus simplex]|uniref:uncharacterized protein isoform X2 n=1 Tax=Anabrus simplex TaxID=316456 RepID=UPI0035A3186A